MKTNGGTGLSRRELVNSNEEALYNLLHSKTPKLDVLVSGLKFLKEEAAINKQEDPCNLEIALSLSYKIAAVYSSLPDVHKELVRDTVNNSPRLTFQFSSLASSNSKSESLASVQVLRDCLKKHKTWLLSLIDRSNHSKVTILAVRSLFFGSKLFNALHKEYSMDIAEYSRLVMIQWRNVAKCDNTDISASFLVTFLALNPVIVSDIVFEDNFMQDIMSYQLWHKTLNKAKYVDSQTLLLRYFLRFLEKFSERNPKLVYKLLKSSSVAKFLSSSQICRFESVRYRQILCNICDSQKLMEVLNSLLDDFITCGESTDLLICETMVMILRCSNFSESQLDEVAQDSRFLNAVTERLKSENTDVRERTMFIAKIITKGLLKYDSDYSIEIPEFNHDLQAEALTKNDFEELKSSSHIYDDFVPSKSYVPKISSDIEKLALSDSDDESDDESIPRLLYIKDLVAEYEKQRTGNQIALLKATVKLVRQKSFYKAEVLYYSESLLLDVITLNNNMDQNDFEQWRVNATVSILVVVPEKIVHLYQILLNSELSLQQRMSLLTAVGLAARELRGYDDTMILKPVYDFPSKRLPWDQSTLQQQNLKKPDHLQNDIMKTEMVTWQSRKLLGKSSKPQKKNNFRQHAPSFFYPLAHTWLNGIEIGTFTKMFKKHFFVTLKIIFECAFPCKEYESMRTFMDQIIHDIVAGEDVDITI